jgi:hypothetical protein
MKDCDCDHCPALQFVRGLRTSLMLLKETLTVLLIRVFTLTLALTFVTAVGVTSFAPQARAIGPCCQKR